MTLPITIVGGYLGAGKTTLVNHLLRHADGVRLAILVNEFGALPIDADLIEAQDESIISIAGGCVCCSYGNDLTMALIEMTRLDPPPDHVVLEASGVALPGAVAASVSLLQDYALDGVVVLANAETIEEQARDTYIADTITRQLTDADLIILNKTDLVPEENRARLANWLPAQAPSASVAEAVHGAVPPAIVLQSFATRVHEAGAHHAMAGFASHSFDLSKPVDADRLAEGLAHPKQALLRAKGFVLDASGTTRAIQVVGRRWAVADAPPTATIGLVAIGPEDRLDVDALTALISAARV